MNLTEPQAGSDLALVRTRAEPQADDSSKLFGTKIFITYGEHDMADNTSTSCSPACKARPKGSRASACSSALSTSLTLTACVAAERKLINSDEKFRYVMNHRDTNG